MFTKPSDHVKAMLQRELQNLQQCIDRVDGRCYWHLSEDQCDQVTRANRVMRSAWMKRCDHIESVLGL